MGYPLLFAGDFFLAEGLRGFRASLGAWARDAAFGVRFGLLGDSVFAGPSFRQHGLCRRGRLAMQRGTC